MSSNIISTLALVTAATLSLPAAGCRQPHETASDTETQTASHREIAAPDSGDIDTVLLDGDALERARLVVEPAQLATYRPSLRAYGKVLDTTSLVEAHFGLLAAGAELTNSTAQLQRTTRLFEDDRNSSQRALDAVNVAFQSKRAEVALAEAHFKLLWGEIIGSLGADERTKLIEEILQHRTFLLRVDVPLGEGDPEVFPVGAHVAIAGHETRFDTSVISLAPMTNPLVPGQGYLLRADSPPVPLRPGDAVVASLDLPGEAREVVDIPRNAVIRFRGQNWVYVVLGTGQFLRRPITILLTSSDGWLADGAIDAEDTLVIGGAQVLLAEELKALLQLAD